MANGENIAAEELVTWLTPRQAVNQVHQAFGDVGVASRAIYERLCGGPLRAAAHKSSWDSGPLHGPLTVPASFWRFIAIGAKADWWETGDVRFYFKTGAPQIHLGRTYRCFGVRFDPTGVSELVAAAPVRRQPKTEAPSPQPTPPEPAKSIGGRPPKPFWDDLLIAIFAQIHRGDLKPRNQADIAKAMLDWASTHDHDLGPTSVKGPARKLFAALRED